MAKIWKRANNAQKRSKADPFFSLEKQAQVVRERRIPFVVSADPFWNEATQRRLEHSYAQLKSGKVQEHALIED